MSDTPFIDYDDDYFDEYEDDEEDENFDCGVMRDMNHRMVGCQKAGSEECDECPYQADVERSLRAQAGWVTRRNNKAAIKAAEVPEP
jgi:hypothetical protein